MRFLITYILLSVLFCATLFSNNNIKFHTLTPKGGLSYDGILDIKQDDKGFIWILIENNIFRFDGYTYKSYNSSFEKNEGEDIGVFINLISDSNGNLYVSTNKHLYKLDYLRNEFIKLDNIPNRVAYIDKKNRLWSLSIDSIVYVNENNELIKPEFTGRKLPISNRIVAENEDNQDIYLFSSYGQVYKLNEDGKLLDDFINVNHLFENESLLCAQIRDNILWMLTSKFSIIQIDLETKQILLKYNKREISNVSIRCAYVSNDNKAYFGTMDGLYIIDPEASTTEHYQNDQTNRFSIPHNSVWSISEDNQKNIWIGTFAGSAAYINQYDENIFETYGLSTDGLNKAPVSGFAVDNNMVYISTEGGGLNILDKSTNAFSYLTHSNIENSLSGNYTKSSLVDPSGNVWIPTFRGGLNKYNPKTKLINIFQSKENDNQSLLSNDIRKIVLEADSGIWIAYQRHSPQISYLSFADNKIKHYSPEIKDDKFGPSDYIYDIYRGNDDKLWLVSSNLLISFDINSKEFNQLTIPSQNNLDASTLCMDNENVIWIGTFGNELIKYDTKVDKFEAFPNILQSEIAEIYSINWSNGAIWLGANDGLYMFNKQTEKCSVYKESDGTQGDVYYRLATYKSEDGLLYFGGTGGFTIIDVNKMNFNPTHPKTNISDFYLDYSPIDNNDRLKLSFNMSDDLASMKLDHTKQNFGFKISSDNFLNPDKNQFKYRLKNYDHKWIYTDASNRIIHYSKIPPGTYYFEFQSANNDGIWGDVSSIKIIRKRAPWFSIPAWILYSIIFASLLYHYISSYNKKRQLENKLYLDQIEKEKNEEIHKNQFLFFTNISHDLKTPLALIMATINRMREEGMKEYYYKILNNNSERLMNLLNDVLDFRNLQRNKIKLSISEGNISKFIAKIATDFNDLATEKNFDYSIDVDNTISKVPFDEKIMEKIALNLLHNAFKYTPSGGKIKVIVTTDDFQSHYPHCHSIIQNDILDKNNSFKIIVRDTGIGIIKESISKVFDRFYKVDTTNEANHLGTGIGLALVKELVSVHKSNITICSEKGKGTDFILQFPSQIYFYGDNDLTGEEHHYNDIEASNDLILTNESSPNFNLDENQEEKAITNIITDKSKTILIAEDNVDLRAIVKSSLEENYNVIDFEDAEYAIEYLKNKDVDLIVSDIMMPIVDGITFSKKIKNNVDTSHIPFILLTAKSGIESRLEGAESGADLYFEKPIDLRLLKTAISNIFKQQEILREHYSKNYFADISEITTNREDNKFMNDVINIIEKNLDKTEFDVNTIATDMMMSRSKLYSKIKSLTGKSIVEFVLNYRLRKAAKFLTEKNITIQEAMFAVGIESRSYFTSSFKKEFGMTPSKFASKQNSSE